MLRKISIAMVIIAVVMCLQAAIVIYSNPQIEKFYFDRTTQNHLITETGPYSLNVEIYPASADVSNSEIKWTSSNPEVATVNSIGMVYPEAVGQTTITAEYGKFKAQCVININPNPVTSVLVEYPTSIIRPDETVQLTASINPHNATYQNVEFVSLNPQIATVSSTGLVTGVSEGDVNILIKAANGVETTKVIQVRNSIPLESFELKLQGGSSSKLGLGAYTIMPEFYPVNADTEVLTWESSNPGVMSVDEHGVVNIKKDGYAVITATSASGKTASISLNVPRVEATDIQIKKPNISGATIVSCTISVGDTLQLTANLYRGISSYPFITSSGITTRELEWSSSNPSRVSISETGLVTAHAEALGVTITVRVKDVPSVSATYNIMVKP